MGCRICLVLLLLLSACAGTVGPAPAEDSYLDDDVIWIVMKFRFHDGKGVVIRPDFGMD